MGISENWCLLLFFIGTFGMITSVASLMSYKAEWIKITGFVGFAYIWLIALMGLLSGGFIIP